MTIQHINKRIKQLEKIKKEEGFDTWETHEYIDLRLELKKKLTSNK